MTRLRDLKSLVHDAVDAPTHLVAEGHDSVARATVKVASTAGLGEPARAVDGLRSAATEAVLASVRGVNRLVEATSDAALDAVAPPEAPAAPRPLTEEALFTAEGAADQLQGVLNGLAGDTLRRRGNGLDLGMSLRLDDTTLDGPLRAERVAVFVHGLSTTETSWCLGAAEALGASDATFGSLLQRDLGYTPLFARYNTGLPVAESGRALAALLDAHLAEVKEIVLVGHSMGGLVSRAATVNGAFVDRLTHVICLASPHRGAPLARFGEAATQTLLAVDHPATRVIGTLLAHRSLGIRDLEREDAPDLGPLLDTVTYLFLAATAVSNPSLPGAHALGDLLVTVRSAEGPDTDHADVHRQRVAGALHHAVQVDPRVYEALRDLLQPARVTPT